MRWDSPLVLALAGTTAVHLILLVFADAVAVYNPPRPPSRPAPRIEMVEIEVPPVLREPPPPVARPPEPEPEPEPERPAPRPQKVVSRPQARQETRAEPAQEAPETETETAPPSTAPGGEHVVTLPDAPPGATGVPVGVGRRTSQRVGRGGTGGGTGTGTGSGAGSDPAAPVSIATVVKQAVPEDGFDHIDLGRDYPAEAKRLGVEGMIRVRLVVDTTGKVRSAVLLNKLGHGLDELALRRARLIRFKPARDANDRAVSSTVVWTFNMTLPK